jgi:hypothetical protein
MGQPLGIFFGVPQDERGQPGGCFLPDTGKAAEFLDQALDGKGVTG